MYISKQTEIWSRSELNGGELKGNIIVSDNNLEKVRKNKFFLYKLEWCEVIKQYQESVLEYRMRRKVVLPLAKKKSLDR